MKAEVFQAAALTVMMNAGIATAHEWYNDLRDSEGRLCCNDRDCYPVGHRYSEENGHEVKISDLWIPVDPSLILPQSSPDNLTHACYYPVWSSGPSGTTLTFSVHCVILGGMS